MADDYWTLDQALGWVRWRNDDVVEKLEAGYYGSMCMYPPSETDSDSGEIILELGNSSDLHSKLKTGQITVRGRQNGKGDYEFIKKEKWVDLEFITPPFKKSFCCFGC